MPTLTVDNLAGSRGDRTLFRDLSFSITGGQCLHITGHNGCGKTTLLRILCGLTQPDSGNIGWNGGTISELRDQFETATSYIGHKNGMHGDLTALENLEFCAQLGGPQSDISPSDALSIFGLRPYGHLPVRQLSQGQQRRTALARLLVNRKSLWILDEPFSGLDIHNTAVLIECIENHLKQDGMLLLTAHHEVDISEQSLSNLNLESYYGQ